MPVGPREAYGALKVMARGELSRYGSPRPGEVAALESDMSTRLDVGHVLALNSGTSALLAALVGLNIGPGDEVLVPAYTWISTAAAPMLLGANPVLVEVDETMTMSPEDCAEKIGPRTRAILPVHIQNSVCNMDALLKLAREQDLFVVEDACQAVGVQYRGRYAGTIGDAGAFSFNHHKNISSGEGGALLTNRPEVYRRGRIYHDVGSWLREGADVAESEAFVGMNFRMSEIAAGMLRPQLRRLDRLIAIRRRRRDHVVARLGRALGGRAVVSPHNDEESAASVFLLFHDEEQASLFAQRRGAGRVIDSGRHVYTNWLPILNGKTHHDVYDKLLQAESTTPFSEQSCPRSLDLMRRTCVVHLAPELPELAFRALVRSLEAPL